MSINSTIQFDYTIEERRKKFEMYRHSFSFSEPIATRLTLDDAAAALLGFEPECKGFFYVKKELTKLYQFVNGELVELL